MIKGIIFDLGGVLLENGFYKAYEKYPQFEVLRERFIEDLERGRMQEEEFKQKVKAINPQLDLQAIEDYVWENFQPIWETNQLLEKLAPQYKIGLLTNNVAGWVERLLEKLPTKDLLEIIVDSSQVGLRKPEPQIYQLTAQKLGLKPQECLFIDDLPVNVEGAQKAGLKGLLYVRGQLAKDLKSLGVSW